MASVPNELWNVRSKSAHASFASLNDTGDTPSKCASSFDAHNLGSKGESKASVPALRLIDVTRSLNDAANDDVCRVATHHTVNTTIANTQIFIVLIKT